MSSHQFLNINIRGMLCSVTIQCQRHRRTRATPRIFGKESIQQPGIQIQQAHGSKSSKGKSRSSTKQRVSDNTNYEEGSTFARSNKRSKITTTRPMCKDEMCPFGIKIFCHSSDSKWYLSCGTNRLRVSLQHIGHMPICSDHVSSRIRNLSSDLDEFIVNLFNAHVPPPTIVNLVKEQYKITLTEGDLYKYRDKVLHELLSVTSKTPYGTPVDKLIANFNKKSDVSFTYVLHDYKSGFVTYRKNKDDNLDNETVVNEDYISVYQSEIDLWRDALTVDKGEKILVAFAWCTDDDLRLANMFPEFLACDVTFGVTKEQRNLFLFAGIDGNNKVFTCFHCYMPSKEARAFNWALRSALVQLLTHNILIFNQCVACDQELVMFQPLRAMMAASQSSLSKSCNRLDKYHLLTKEWLDNVQCKVDKKDTDAKLILKVLKDKLSRLFDYVETSTELQYSINDYKHYYNNHKKQLKSEQVLKSIEDIFHSINNNVQFFAHCYFLNVCTFNFKGDSIVEAANSGFKSGSLSVNTSMKIHTSTSTQVKIGKNQSLKKHKCVYMN